MTSDFTQAMRRALEQTRGADPMAATRTIQAALSGGTAPAEAEVTQAPRLQREYDIPDAEIVEDHPGPSAKPARAARTRPSLGDVMQTLSKLKADRQPWRADGATLPVPDGAHYSRRHYSGPAGERDYTLFVPSPRADGPLGLIMMLHGCTQTSDDFARGTEMNALAEANGLIVVYPEQARAENAQGCWNWFRPGDQRAGRGEPELLAGLARALTDDYGIDRRNVFVAGLSAGGAMAAILSVTHPEVFHAAGIHSGLPAGAAQDVMSAFTAMRGQSAASTAIPTVPMFIIHGSEDSTVHASNAHRLFDLKTSQGEVVRDMPGSPGFKGQHRVATDAAGRAAAELWLVDGIGHAWSGGNAAGSYTAQNGPNASAEMVRFFLSSGS